MITISQVTTKDIPLVKRLLSYTWNDTYSDFYPIKVIKKITSVWHDPKKLAQQAADQNIFFAMAKNEQGELIGLITIRKTDENTMFISRLYIHPEHQRKGIGTQLMQTALNYFPKLKLLKLECEKQNNKACSFYLKHGFKIIKEKEESIEGILIKTVEMEKLLNK